MINLTSGKTKDYSGGGTLRREIRRLRSLKLLDTPHGYVGDMQNGSKFNLADYATITDLGREWVNAKRDTGKSGTTFALFVF